MQVAQGKVSRASLAGYALFCLCGVAWAIAWLIVASPFGYLNSWNNVAYALVAIPGILLLWFGWWGIARRRLMAGEKKLSLTMARVFAIFILLFFAGAYVFDLLLHSSGF